ncbi:hypothetical protein [Cellulomonas triticagri]|uniref:Uncharacterized protein n=1 Tax=Cellulomonas triticagri TaxID=2483352 RepID=A0A3M2JFQ0_9CELL|nr:hypothetical protein [Cellulomonas triticagri]RMI12847.1 hypothetical protein EBM89_07025 [Cellulomonas triticagri]
MPLAPRPAPGRQPINPARAVLTPWNRAATFVGLLMAGIGLWVLGTQGPDAARPAMNVAWVPFVIGLILTTRWQRQAQHQADDNETEQPPPEQ